MTVTGSDLAGFSRLSIRVEANTGSAGIPDNGPINTVFRSIGSGPDLVFLHGGGTFMGFDWARDLAADFRLLLPHHPDFGDSSDAGFSSASDYARHYERVFDAMGLERFHLAGASMGAMIALNIAVRNPDRVDRLALVTPAGLISPEVSPPDFTGVAPEDVPAYFVRDPNFIEAYWPRNPTPEFAALLARERAAAARLRDFSPEADARMRNLIQGISAPVLLLWGADDRVLGPGLLDEWRRELPDADWALIENGAHMLLEEFPEARRAMRRFLLNQS